jgi:AraC-like DNA-binding protein
MCAHCDADDANKDWSIDARSNVGAVDDITSDDRSAPTMPLAEIAGRQRHRRAPKRAAAARLLRNREERELVHYVDRWGRWRGYYERARFLSRREIARRAGCSHTYVNRIFRESISISIAARSSRR